MKDFIKKHIAIFVISVIAIIVISIIVKYQVEGETNPPFSIQSVMVISSASGVQKENSQSKLELNIVQYNDIYINIKKNKNYGKQEIIEKIVLDNFVIEEEPINGEVKIYRPNSDEKLIYTDQEEYTVNDELIYTGSQKSSINNLEIANQGGTILLRYANENLGVYTTDENEVRHDGTLLGKIGTTSEDIKFKISFDVAIQLHSDKKYKANITLEMPKGNLIEQGTTSFEKNTDIVFKRY